MTGEDIAKLRKLLGYWIEHNREHSQEFREWAGRVAGDGAAGAELRQAAEQMDRAGGHLSRALDELETGEG